MTDEERPVKPAGVEAPQPEELWAGTFGNAYVERNAVLYERRQMFWQRLLAEHRIGSALEVGCGQGANLRWLVGLLPPDHVWGVDVNVAALERAAVHAAGAHLVRASARELPFEDTRFDLVYTVGVLIHQPDDGLAEVMDEIVRCARRFVLSAEYHADQPEAIVYRGVTGALFKRPYGRLYQERFPSLTLLREGYLGSEDGFDRITYQLFERS